MTNNFKANDLKEIIVACPPQRLTACSPHLRIRALQKNAKLNPDRTAVDFRTVRKRWSPQADEAAPKAHPASAAMSDSICA
jgi:hypothetical protein